MQKSVFFVLLLASSVAFVQAGPGIDYARCTTLNGREGQSLQCPTESYITSFCASGRYPDCNGGASYTQVKCCPQLPATTANIACTNVEGGYGALLVCPGAQQAAVATCTSGGAVECGTNVVQRVVCCDNPGLEISSTCQWFYGAGYGQIVDCPINWVMRGQCSGGSKLDCNAGQSSNGAYCCQLNVD